MRLLSGVEYAHSSQKLLADRFLTALLYPAELAVRTATAYELQRQGIADSIVFEQERVGVDGVAFLIHKYRTLRPGTEVRISRLTDLFRRTGLDETAQRRNVVEGAMSFVGHRPLTPTQHEEMFDSVSPELGQKWRDIVLPTRPGQISSYGLHSHVGITDGIDSPEYRMELDIKDVLDGSLKYDLSLCLETLQHAVTNKLAHGSIRASEA